MVDEPKVETSEAVRRYLLNELAKAFLLTSIALVILLIGSYSWWIGFILFIPFALLVAVDIFFHFGLFAVFWVAIMVCIGFVKRLGSRLDRLDERTQAFKDLGFLSATEAGFAVYLIVLIIGLTWFFWLYR
jgi:hypothetical protein